MSNKNNELFLSKDSENSCSEKLILISFDGFRWDYVEKAKEFGFQLPNFDFIQNNGVRSKSGLKVAVPTITLPNHQSLVTGLYPESHEIVLNDFRDPLISQTETFHMGDQNCLNDEKWFQGWPEPIWVTLQRANRLSASLLWPNTDAKVSNDLPFQQVSQYIMLNGYPARYPYKKRISDTLWWLDNPRYIIDLVLLYFDEPDETGHQYGPNSIEVAKKVKLLDDMLGLLIDGISQNPKLANKVNIILTADHGMAQLSESRVIEIDRYIDPDLYTYTLLTPIAAIYPKQESQIKMIYEKLKLANDNWNVYLKEDVPTEFHYSNNRRIAPIIVVANNGYSIVHNSTINPVHGGGNHGYDNNESDMHAHFMAIGPAFRRGFLYDGPAFEVVDVYPLMCHLLGLEPNQNNGSLSRINIILADHKN